MWSWNVSLYLNLGVMFVSVRESELLPFTEGMFDGWKYFPCNTICDNPRFPTVETHWNDPNAVFLSFTWRKQLYCHIFDSWIKNEWPLLSICIVHLCMHVGLRVHVHMHECFTSMTGIRAGQTLINSFVQGHQPTWTYRHSQAKHKDLTSCANIHIWH